MLGKTQKVWYAWTRRRKKNGSACVPVRVYGIHDITEPLSTYDVHVGMGDNQMATKITVTHPHGTSRNVGVLIFKRIVSHRCTGGPGCAQGSMVADVYKLGWCIKCDRNIWRSRYGQRTTKSQRQRFSDECIARAFDANGKIKASFRCKKGSKDFKRAQLNIMTF